MSEKGRKKENAQSNFVEYVFQHRNKREMHEYSTKRQTENLESNDAKLLISNCFDCLTMHNFAVRPNRNFK